MKQGKAAVAWLKNRVRIVDLRAKGPPRHARHGEGRPAARRHRRCRTPGGAVVPSGRTHRGGTVPWQQKERRQNDDTETRPHGLVSRQVLRAGLAIQRHPHTPSATRDVAWRERNAKVGTADGTRSQAHHRDTPPEYERPSWQVSWLAGHRLCLAFPMPAGTSDT